MTLGDAIRAYREEHGMSMDVFADRSGISKSYISLLEKNQHPKTGKPIIPTIKTYLCAAQAMNIDFDTLIRMINDNVDISPEIPSYSNITSISKQTFPLYDGIAAGQPRLMPDGIETYVESTTDIKADFALRVHGDSMIGARIYDGDLVFIREQPDVENGEIAAVAIGDEATLKRVYRYGDTLSLRAENPAYKEMVFTGEELNNIKILGKAIAFQSDIL